MILQRQRKKMEKRFTDSRQIIIKEKFSQRLFNNCDARVADSIPLLKLEKGNSLQGATIPSLERTDGFILINWDWNNNNKWSL